MYKYNSHPRSLFIYSALTRVPAAQLKSIVKLPLSLKRVCTLVYVLAVFSSTGRARKCVAGAEMMHPIALHYSFPELGASQDLAPACGARWEPRAYSHAPPVHARIAKGICP